MTISEALKNGKNHIVCVNGVEFDIKLLSDGGFLLHHIEKNGRPLSKNRTKMPTVKDAEIWVKKKHGGINHVEEGKYEKFIPEPEGMEGYLESARGAKRPEPKASVAGYEYDEEPAAPEENDEWEEYEEERPMQQIDIEDDGMPDLSRPGYAQYDAPDETQDADFTPDFKEEGQYADYQTYDDPNAYPIMQGKASVILEDMVMTGNIQTQGSVEVLGVLRGDIAADGNVTVTGCVNGNIAASKDVSITGENGAEILGNIQGDKVLVDGRCAVIGDIAANDLIIEGAVKGNIDVQGKLVIRATSTIKGNIISMSIMVEDGAVIDGNCVQKYAPSTADSFFDNYTIRLTGKPLNPEAGKRAKKSNNPAPSITPSEIGGDTVIDDDINTMGISQIING